MDQETARRTDSCVRGWRTDPLVPAPLRRVAGQQQVANGPEGRRPGWRRSAGAAFPDASEPDRPDWFYAAPSQGALHLLPWRGAARSRLAIQIGRAHV